MESNLVITRTKFHIYAIGNLQIAEGAAPFLTADVAKAVAAGGFILPTALVLMFIGGAGKSAMFPLHIWHRERIGWE